MAAIIEPTASTCPLCKCAAGSFTCHIGHIASALTGVSLSEFADVACSFFKLPKSDRFCPEKLPASVALSTFVSGCDVDKLFIYSDMDAMREEGELEDGELSDDEDTMPTLPPVVTSHAVEPMPLETFHSPPVLSAHDNSSYASPQTHEHDDAPAVHREEPYAAPELNVSATFDDDREGIDPIYSLPVNNILFQ